MPVADATDVAPASEVASAAAPETAVSATQPANHAIVSEEAEPLDLMSLAGSSVYKRLIPVGIAGAIILALIVYFATK